MYQKSTIKHYFLFNLGEIICTDSNNEISHANGSEFFNSNPRLPREQPDSLILLHSRPLYAYKTVLI